MSESLPKSFPIPLPKNLIQLIGFNALKNFLVAVSKWSLTSVIAVFTKLVRGLTNTLAVSFIRAPKSLTFWPTTLSPLATGLSCNNHCLNSPATLWKNILNWLLSFSYFSVNFSATLLIISKGFLIIFPVNLATPIRGLSTRFLIGLTRTISNVLYIAFVVFFTTLPTASAIGLVIISTSLNGAPTTILPTLYIPFAAAFAPATTGASNPLNFSIPLSRKFSLIYLPKPVTVSMALPAMLLIVPKIALPIGSINVLNLWRTS